MTVAARDMSFEPGWDRRDRLTLRFINPVVEQSYLDDMAVPATQRLGIACMIGVPLWLGVGFLAAPLLDIPPAPIIAAALVNAGIEFAVILRTRRTLTLHRVWATATFLTTLGAVGIVFGLAAGGAFLLAGAIAMTTNGVTGVALVRPAGWIGATLGLIHVVLFFAVIVALGLPLAGVFQGFLLMGTLGAAFLGSRYLEGAERTSFARGYLIADLHRRIDRLFRQYMSPDVAQSLVDDPARAELGGELIDITVLFADLRGYTSFSERTPPREVVAMLNSSFAAVVPAVFHEGGTVVQFAGDALMAIFNAPLRQADHALRACRAALALQEVTQSIAAPGDRPLFRVGINTGPALVGNIGSAEMRNFSALGDTTNVAARLQTYADEGSIVIGESTYDIVKDSVDARALGSAALKGKQAAVPVYELLGIREMSTSPP
jgi:class 3 adenylate cyclase